MLLVLLMQGCKREQPQQQTEDPYNSAVFTDSNAPAMGSETNFVATEPDTNAVAQPPTTVTPPETVTPTPTAVTPEASMTEYTVQKGDTFSTIAPKFHISVKALQTANPTVDPAKLQIGKKLNIPAAPATATTSTAAASGATVVDTASGTTTYTVKSGDTLGKLATDFRTTVKAIQTANGLTDTRIKVGQKLKIPAK
ncbi:MAG: LysM peptidoglycan-binding domain-containing protein [Verrucomicrobiota bacterium]